MHGEYKNKTNKPKTKSETLRSSQSLVMKTDIKLTYSVHCKIYKNEIVVENRYIDVVWQ